MRLAAENALDELRICNCAGCRAVLGGRTQTASVLAAVRDRDVIMPPVVAGFVNDRPYCRSCLNDQRAVR